MLSPVISPMSLLGLSCHFKPWPSDRGPLSGARPGAARPPGPHTLAHRGLLARLLPRLAPKLGFRGWLPRQASKTGSSRRLAARRGRVALEPISPCLPDLPARPACPTYVPNLRARARPSSSLRRCWALRPLADAAGRDLGSAVLGTRPACDEQGDTGRYPCPAPLAHTQVSRPPIVAWKRRALLVRKCLSFRHIGAGRSGRCAG